MRSSMLLNSTSRMNDLKRHPYTALMMRAYRVPKGVTMQDMSATPDTVSRIPRTYICILLMLLNSARIRNA